MLSSSDSSGLRLTFHPVQPKFLLNYLLLWHCPYKATPRSTTAPLHYPLVGRLEIECDFPFRVPAVTPPRALFSRKRISCFSNYITVTSSELSPQGVSECCFQHPYTPRIATSMSSLILRNPCRLKRDVWRET